MSKSKYPVVSGIIFLIVGIAHGVRAARGLPIRVGTFGVPIGVSWAAAVGGILLCIWAFQSRKGS